jgi:hypothetical protein
MSALSADYICGGPLLEAAGITAQQVQQDAATWEKLGRQLALQLGFEHDAMDEVQRCVTSSISPQIDAVVAAE